MADLAEACGADPNLLCEAVFEWTDNETLAKLADWFVDRPLRIILIIAVALVASRILRRAVTQFSERLATRQREQSVDPDDAELLAQLRRRVGRIAALDLQRERASQRALTLGVVLRSLVSGVVWFVAGLLILGQLEIDLAPLIAGAGIAGIAIGFGAQSMVRDFLAGIFVIIEDQYGVGDVVDVGDATGVVETVSLRTTQLRDISGVLWTVPNGEIKRVGNHSQLWSNSRLNIDVAYDTDIDHATYVIKQVLDEVWQEDLDHATVIEEPEVLGVDAFGPDSITIAATVKTEPSEQWAVARIIRARIKAAFDEEGIEIPFPQRTVWIRSEAATT